MKSLQNKPFLHTNTLFGIESNGSYACYSDITENIPNAFSPNQATEVYYRTRPMTP
jgi:hypothetical protein